MALTGKFIMKYALLSFFCLIYLAGCSTAERISGEDDKRFAEEIGKEISGAVSIHTILTYSGDSGNELSVQDFFSAQDVRVDAVPWLTSAEIKDIVPVERPTLIRETYDLKLTLTDKGRKQWDAIVRKDDPESAGYAFLVDGVFYSAFHPRRFYNAKDREIVLEGPFDKVISERLFRQAPMNYLKLKKKKSEK